MMTQVDRRKGAIVLNKLQVDFLLLYITGTSSEEMMECLKIDRKQLSYIKFVLKVKFKTRDWKLLVIKALEEGILNINDLTHDITRTTAFAYARRFCKSNFGTVISFLPQASIEQFVLDFYNTCETEFSKLGNSVAFNDLQKKFLWLQVRDVQCTNVRAQLNTTSLEHLLLKQSILNSLHVSNMFGAIRKAFQYNILHKSPFSLPQLANEIKDCARAISQLDFNAKPHSKQEFMVYDELIKFYVNLERTYLL